MHQGPRRLRGGWRCGAHVLAGLILATAVPAAARAQEPATTHQHPPSEQGTDAHAAHGAPGSSLFTGRDTAGTSWAPASTVMYASHRQLGAWSTMLMGNAFAQYVEERAPIHRGGRQAGSVNWMMTMARRPLGAGIIGARVMLSAEPFTIGGCGYPDLLATGEICDGDGIHDRQHPHDLVMELAGEYSRPIAGGLRWHLYGGLAGEPALGPVAFPHRAASAFNPLAPVSHHWLDATHIAQGVVTGGISSERWRAEASAFNGREPDEHRTNLGLDRLDSMSGRVQWAAVPGVVLQVSAGHLREAEAGEGRQPATDVTRVTASAMYQGTVAARRVAGTVAWGRNAERGVGTQAVLLEASVVLRERHAVFGRAEVTDKPAHDLHIHEATEGTVFTVAKVQGGYLRLLRARGALQTGLGASVSASVVPPPIRPNYGGVGVGFAVFGLVRPAASSP